MIEHPRAFAVLVAFTVVMVACIVVSRRRGGVSLRSIPGVQRLDEAIERASTVGRPVLYVPGIEGVQDVQTLYSLMVLEHVAERAARGGVPLIVPTKDSVVLALAQDAVRHGCERAGRPELADGAARYLSDEQFAFCAGIAGIMVREHPGAHVFFGHFYAESLFLAELGRGGGAMQVAGTAEFYQMPYFVASCDATILGEEYYAVTAAITRDPTLGGALVAGDLAKLLLVAVVVLYGVLWAVASWAPDGGVTDAARVVAEWLRAMGARS